jgi:Uma2 family endonuclease
MSTTAVLPAARGLTAADLTDRFGPIPLTRVRFDPWPGNATEQDVLDIHNREKRLYELVDGILVEKVMGYPESALALILARILGNWVQPRRLGILAGEAGMMRLTVGRVRIPDISFVSWGRLPGRRRPRKPLPDLSPDLAIEVLSESNTDEEMTGKRQDYFASGTRLVWQIDPEKRTVDVYTAPDTFTRLDANSTLDGGDVLPGFTLPLAQLFAELDEDGPPIAGATP